MSSNLTLNQSGFANLTIRGSSTVLVLRSGAIVPLATANTAGSVIVGANLTVNSNGVLSVILPANYTLPVANATQLGGVKVGANLAIDGNGVLSANTPNVSGYMPSMPPVTNGNLTLSTTPSATTTIQGWQTTGLLASNSTVNQIGFSQSGAAGINMVQWRYPTAGGSINQIGLLSLSSGGITSCSTTYDSSANYTSSTRISQSSTALSFFGNRYVSNGTLDGTGCISLSFASVGQPLTGNSTICQLNSTGNLTGSARQSQLYCIANATNTYIGVGGFTSQYLYWDDNSLLIRSYADGRYLTPSNAAASYYPLTGNPSGFLTALPVANATQLGGVKIGSNISADANGVISVAIPAGYTLPTANTTQLGGVKIGANLTIDANGVLSANASGGGGGTGISAAKSIAYSMIFGR